MQKKLIFLILFNCLFWYSKIFINAQDLPAVSKGKIKFYVDNSAFKNLENAKVIEEFYLMVYADQLHQIIYDNKKYADFGIKETITDASGNQVNKKEWTTKALINYDSLSIKGLVIYDQWTEDLNPGSYSIQISVWDKNGTDEGEARLFLKVNGMNERQFSVSQLEFVSDITHEIMNPQFVKNNQTVFPNPTRRYGILNPILYFYYELYNIPDTSNGNLQITYNVKNENGITIMTLPTVVIKKNSSFLSLLQGINVVSLSSGIYEFDASIADSFSNSNINLSRKFEVIQMDYLNQKQTLTYRQAKIAGNYLKYIATPEQYKLYEKLNLTGKAQFLIQFWQEKDESHDINENKYLARIKDRYNYANQHFRNAQKEGWSTDRGRIIIKYGMPDEIEYHNFETDSVPYEIWYYHQNKNYEFDFADLHNDGNYELVNSTKENELQNNQWKELISN